MVEVEQYENNPYISLQKIKSYFSQPSLLPNECFKRVAALESPRRITIMVLNCKEIVRLIQVFKEGGLIKSWNNYLLELMITLS